MSKHKKQKLNKQMHGDKAKEALIGDEGIITSNGYKYGGTYFENSQTKAL